MGSPNIEDSKCKVGMLKKVTYTGDWEQRSTQFSGTIRKAVVSVDNAGIQVTGPTALNIMHIVLASFVLLFLVSTGIGVIVVPFYWAKIVSIYTGKYKSVVLWQDVEQIAFSQSEMLLYGSKSDVRVIFCGPVSHVHVTQRMPASVKISSDIDEICRLIQTDDLVLSGRWRSHWSFKRELTRNGRLSILSNGIEVVGYQTSFWRQSLFGILVLLTMLCCSVGFFGAPTIALYLSQQLGYLSLPLLKNYQSW